MTEAAPVTPSEESGGTSLPASGLQLAAARIWALIPCAGSGTRAARALPKQYHPIAGRALVLHTLAAFAAVPRLAGTLVVVAADDRFFAGLAPVLPAGCTSAACGGDTRALSVANGLASLRERGASDQDWVLVHDAARCLVTPELVERLIDGCADDAVGGLLALPVSDTLKLADGDRVCATRDRARHWLAQTPQMFRLGVLRAALQSAGGQVTDEASAIEAMGLAPKLVAGSAANFKVTYPEDFVLAAALLAGRGRKRNQELDYDYP